MNLNIQKFVNTLSHRGDEELEGHIIAITTDKKLAIFVVMSHPEITEEFTYGDFVLVAGMNEYPHYLSNVH